MARALPRSRSRRRGHALPQPVGAGGDIVPALAGLPLSTIESVGPLPPHRAAPLRARRDEPLRAGCADVHRDRHGCRRGARGHAAARRACASASPPATTRRTIAIGASIACSGPCLTVVERGIDGQPRLLRRGGLDARRWRAPHAAPGRPGTRVNLERSLKLGDELGGHHRHRPYRRRRHDRRTARRGRHGALHLRGAGRPSPATSPRRAPSRSTARRSR